MDGDRRMFEESFPKSLRQDVVFVCGKIAEKTCNDALGGQSEQSLSWILLNGEKITFPYRVYYPDELENTQEGFTAAQQIIYHCIFSRSCNGYVREKHVRALLAAEMPDWAMPYIIKVCDEYVIEIPELVYGCLKDADTTLYKELCKKNLPLFLYGYRRMISYWNEFYRSECPEYAQYIGRRLYQECFGYTRAMEKIKSPPQAV